MALLAFAGNSILCRLALADSSIDATSFTLIRLISGAIMLILILLIKGNVNQINNKGSWPASLALFIYAAGFSYAYIELDTGVGALILFACVQITMLVISWYYGARLTLVESLGVLVAFAGFIYLVSPGVNSPSIFGVTLMALAGIAWGCYSIIGSRSATPLIDTSSNFIRASVISLVLTPVLFIESNQLQTMGVVYALASGMITSGVGYAIWYKVLPHIRSSVAAVLQLSVPAIAALGGLLLLEELLTMKMLISSGAILGGIALVIYGKQQQTS
ncbi:DMT family transporter [Aliiglaciecola sp. 2_MG-2023]|nr:MULTISPECIES: DMT family transporter [unclassified Aliiglaciecola]MDO6712487.1 DMT family transporter [Aliiglaciecola sp. 2_MG-2023]MDO6753455.1 DMT family transporter [Aliiglaciecola sp. 1_MG-2023]